MGDLTRRLRLRSLFLVLLPSLLFLLSSCPTPSSSGEGDGGDGGDGSPSYTPEGSILSPIEIPPNTPYTGQVDTTRSYYKSWGEDTDDSVSVLLSELIDDADVLEYDTDATFTAHPAPRSSNMPFYGRIMPEWTSNRGYSTNDIYFVVDGSYTEAGTSFTIEVQSYGVSESVLHDEGDAADPYPYPAGYYWSGQVSTGGTSYYKVAVTPGVAYRVNTFDPVNASVYTDQFSTLADGPAEKCGPVTAAGDFLYLTVVPQDTGRNFQMEIVRAEGSTVSPVPLFVGKDNYNQVDDTASYYIFETTPGGDYRVEVTKMTDNVDVYCYNDAAFTDLEGSGANTRTADERFEVYGVGNNIYVKIYTTASPDYGATYALTVTVFVSD